MPEPHVRHPDHLVRLRAVDEPLGRQRIGGVRAVALGLRPGLSGRNVQDARAHAGLVRYSRPFISSERHRPASSKIRGRASPPESDWRSSISRAINASSASPIAGALVAQTSIQVSAGLDASRVASTRPRPASLKPSGPAVLPMTSMSALAVNCGRWLRNAITRSWASASRTEGRAPRPRAKVKSDSTTAGEAPSSGVKIHGRPLNMSGRANPKPPRSAPPIGCPPTKASFSRSTRAASTMSRLVPPTSVTTVVDEMRCATSASRTAFCRTGAARMTRSTSPISLVSPAPRSMAPPPSAWAITEWRSTPSTRTAGQRSRTPRAIDPPMRPRPTMAILLNGGSSLVDTRFSRLPRPPASRHRLQADAAADGRGDDAQLRHQAIELRGEHRLCAVAERVIGIVVDLDDQAVSACRHGGAGKLRDHVAATGAVARIRDDRQVAQLLDHRDGGDVERVPRCRLERADAALAEDDVVVAAGQDVFRRQQPLLDRRRDTALEQHRLALVTQFPQQGEVLHVAGADLEDVTVVGDQLDLAAVHHLRDQLQVVGVGRAPQHLQSRLAQPLEAVG